MSQSSLTKEQVKSSHPAPNLKPAADAWGALLLALCTINVAQFHFKLVEREMQKVRRNVQQQEISRKNKRK